MRAFVANISDYEKEKVQNKRQKISLKYVNISCDEQKMIENEKKRSERDERTDNQNIYYVHAQHQTE